MTGPFSIFAPVQKFWTAIDVQHPYVEKACRSAWTGSADAGSNRWAVGYDRYGDEFEEAYKSAFMESRKDDYDGDPEMAWERVENFMGDPWNLAGLSMNQMTNKTLNIGETLAMGGESQAIIEFVELFERDGNIPDEIPDDILVKALPQMQLVKSRRWADRAVNSAVHGWDYTEAMKLREDFGADRIAEVEAALVTHFQARAEDVLLVLREDMPIEYVIAMKS